MIRLRNRRSVVIHPITHLCGYQCGAVVSVLRILLVSLLRSGTSREFNDPLGRDFLLHPWYVRER